MYKNAIVKSTDQSNYGNISTTINHCKYLYYFMFCYYQCRFIEKSVHPVHLVDDGGFHGLYDDNVTATTNIDALGRRSGAVIYDNAYTAVSSCSPSLCNTYRSTNSSKWYVWTINILVIFKVTVTFYIPNLLNKHNYTTGIIGKYHVGPVDNYNFTYGLGYHGDDCWAGASQPCKSDYNQVSRNITNMKNYANEFFRNFNHLILFLYVGFGDTSLS